VRQFDLSHQKLQVLPVLFPLAVNSTIKVSVVLFWFPGSCCAIPFSLPCSNSGLSPFFFEDLPVSEFGLERQTAYAQILF